MGFGCNPDPDVTMTPGGKQDTGLSPLLTAFASLDLSLSTGHEPFCLSLFLSHHVFALHNRARLPSALRHWLRYIFSSQAQDRNPWVGLWIFVSCSVFIYR